MATWFDSVSAPTTPTATATPSLYQSFGIDPNGAYRANDLQAAVTRQQYMDYEKRFQPYLQSLNSMVSDENVAAEKTRWTADIAAQASKMPEQAMGMASRNQSRYGTSSDSRAQGYGMKMAELTSASNQVAQTNKARQDIDDRAMVLLSGQKLSENM